MGHLKSHWWKYYLGVGVAYTAYNMYEFVSTRNAGFAVKGVFLWPLDMYQSYKQGGSLLEASHG